MFLCGLSSPGGEESPLAGPIKGSWPLGHARNYRLSTDSQRLESSGLWFSRLALHPKGAGVKARHEKKTKRSGSFFSGRRACELGLDAFSPQRMILARMENHIG